MQGELQEQIFILLCSRLSHQWSPMAHTSPIPMLLDCPLPHWDWVWPCVFLSSMGLQLMGGYKQRLEKLLCIRACCLRMVPPPCAEAQSGLLEDDRPCGAETSHQSWTQPLSDPPVEFSCKSEPSPLRILRNNKMSLF